MLRQKLIKNHDYGVDPAHLNPCLQGFSAYTLTLRVRAALEKKSALYQLAVNLMNHSVAPSRASFVMHAELWYMSCFEHLWNSLLGKLAMMDIYNSFIFEDFSSRKL